MSAVLTFVSFWALLGLTLSRPERRKAVFARSRRDWCLDLAGLTVQGILVPILLVVPLVACCEGLWPAWRGALVSPAWMSFTLAFVCIDYAYYWNHRLLHTAYFWPIHRVHHSAPEMDVLVTSRNTLWTSFLIVYLWANTFFTFALRDPEPYLLGAGLTAVLDLARHSPLSLAGFPTLERSVGLVLVLPHDHARHHTSSPDDHGNYGANLVWWDKLHGTYRKARGLPEPLGVAIELGLARSLLWPFGRP